MTHPSRCDDTAGVSQFGLTGSSPPPSSSCWPARLSPLLHRNSSSVSCHSPSAWLIQTTRSSPCPVSRSVQTDPVMTPEPMKDKHGNVFIFTLNLFAWGWCWCSSFHVCYTRPCETGQTWPSVSASAPESSFSPWDLGGKSNRKTKWNVTIWHDKHSGEFINVEYIPHSQVWGSSNEWGTKPEATKICFRIWCQRRSISTPPTNLIEENRLPEETEANS